MPTHKNSNRDGSNSERKTKKKTQPKINYVTILFNGFTGTKKWWEYGFNGNPELPKIDFLDQLKKLGPTHTFNLPIFNLNYYMKADDPAERELWSAINKKYKLYTNDINFDLSDLDYKNICQKVYADVQHKYGPNKKYIVIGHSFGGPLALLFCKLYAADCALCCCIDHVPYILEFYKKHDEHTEKTRVLGQIPDNATLQRKLSAIKNKSTPQTERNQQIVAIYDLYSYLLSQYRIKYYDPKLYVPTVIFKAKVDNPSHAERNRYNNQEQKLFRADPNLREFIFIPNAEHHMWRDPKVSAQIIDRIKAQL